MPGIRQRFGRRGERIAARFLRRRGLAIVARNYRCRAGEVDLVALEGTTIVFVEVKTRTGGSYGEPVEAVGRHKQRRIARAAADFVQRHRLHDRPLRFDIVSVRRRGWRLACEHLRDAFDLCARPSRWP